MKILHISTALTWRGGEQQVYFLTKQLADSDFQQFVLTPTGSALSEKLKQENINLLLYNSRGILNLKLAALIAGVCKKFGISLIHTHDSHAHTAAVLSCSFFGNKNPVIVSRRVDFPISKSIFSKWKYNHSSVKRILCVSEKIRDITLPDIRKKEKLRVIHSGIDIQRFIHAKKILKQEYNIPENFWLIGNVSALADHKDYPVFIETAAIVLKNYSDVKFIIAGEGELRSNLEKLVNDKGLHEQIIFTGFRKDIPDILASLDIFLITSKTEGLGTVILEAFAAGVPVVATRAGGIPEIVKDGETGLTAGIKDSESLAKAVLRLLEDENLLKTIRENARTFVQNFSFENTARKTLEEYRAVLQK